MPTFAEKSEKMKDNKYVTYTSSDEDMPIGGPANWEEALADIEDSERDIDAGHGTPWEVVKELMEERINSYAGQVY